MTTTKDLFDLSGLVCTLLGNKEKQILSACDWLKWLQELQQLQEDHALNYNTLKKKIISTDLLIKKYKAKSEDHEAQTKKLEETLKKCDQLQRESETLREQLGSSLQQLEPFKRAKESMEAENRLKDVEIQSLNDRLTSAVSARQQYENLSKSNSSYKDKYDEYRKEMAKKIQVLESSNQKQEAQISKLRGDVEQVRVMLYNCMTVPYMSYVTLGLAVVSIWPDALYKTCTDPNPVVTVMEHCIMGKMRIDEKRKHDKIRVCYTKLCNWMCPLQSNDSLLKSLLQRLDAETKTKKMKKSKNKGCEYSLFSLVDGFGFVAYTQITDNFDLKKFKIYKLRN